jgi:polysaccharide pyruvyl transferase WcaK-like protein
VYLEIHGAGFANKGAEMMLRTVVSELAARCPGIAPAIDSSYGTYTERAELRLMQIVPQRLHVGVPGAVGRFLRQRVFAAAKARHAIGCLAGVAPRTLGIIDLRAIGGFVDIAGFAYSDQWGPWGVRAIRDLARIVRYYVRRGCPCVLLPQALGPFECAASRRYFKEVVTNASLICPRDSQSVQYVRELCPESERIEPAPELTLFYPRAEPHSVPQAQYVCIVPNVNVVSQVESAWRGRYIELLGQVGRALLGMHINVVMVVHDRGGGDDALAEALVSAIGGSDLSIVRENNPLALKRIIGASLFVVASRFHSVVAALSSGVPALVIGWSHKYAGLLKDFHCDELLVTSSAHELDVLEHVRALANVDVNTAYRARIIKRLGEMTDTNEAMWQHVTRIFGQASK